MDVLCSSPTWSYHTFSSTLSLSFHSISHFQVMYLFGHTKKYTIGFGRAKVWKVDFSKKSFAYIKKSMRLVLAHSLFVFDRWLYHEYFAESFSTWHAFLLKYAWTAQSSVHMYEYMCTNLIYMTLSVDYHFQCAYLLHTNYAKQIEIEERIENTWINLLLWTAERSNSTSRRNWMQIGHFESGSMKLNQLANW